MANYKESTVPIGEFNTVEGFFQFYKHIPSPRQLFAEGHIIERGGQIIEVTGISMFKKGIDPKYEDIMNINGGEFGCRKGFKEGEYLDNAWETLLFGLIGETYEDGNEITGVRLVNKSKGGRAVYKVEVWYKDETKSDMKAKLQAHLGNLKGTLITDWTSRGHK